MGWLQGIIAGIQIFQQLLPVLQTISTIFGSGGSKAAIDLHSSVMDQMNANQAHPAALAIVNVLKPV